jgi:small-conductance mechanosensitive channel
MVDWLLHHGTRIAIVVLLALLVYWLARRSVPRGVRMSVPVQEGELDEELRVAEHGKRVETLSRVLVRTFGAALAVIVVLVVLGELGLPLAPLIAGAGIIGIAIAFGAQTLVRDLLAGVFILVERQFAVGDAMRVAGIGGVVEDLNLRRTVLRDIDGIEHSVPNGEIRVASNLTRGWSRVNLNITVGYDEDLDHVQAVIDRTGTALAADPEWAPLIIEPPAVLRVEGFEESGIAVKVLAKTKAMEQWKVAGELRSRIKAAFDAEGITIPYPHRVVVVRHEQPGA